MKNLQKLSTNRIVTIIILALLPCLSKAEQKGKIVFNVTEWNFGVVKAEDGPVAYDFKLKNVSDATVRIGNLAPSCSCVIAKMSDKVLSPGEEGVIEFILNPSGAEGLTLRTVDVYDAEGEHIALLSVFAEVQDSIDDLQQHYSIMLSENLLANRQNLSYGYVHWGESPEQIIGIVNPSSKDIQIEVFAEGSLDAPLRIDYPRTLKAGEHSQVVVEYSLPDDFGKYTSFENELIFMINGERAAKAVKAECVVIPEIRKTGADPSLRSYPSVSEMDYRFFRKDYRGEIEIGNTGKSALKILGVKTDAVTNIKAGAVLQPGESMVVEAVSSRPEARIELFTNDPSRPYKELIFNNNQ